MLNFLKKGNAKVNPSITRIPTQKIEKTATNELHLLDQEFNSIHTKLSTAKNNQKALQSTIQSREPKIEHLKTISNSIGDLSSTMQQCLNPAFSRLSEFSQIFAQLSESFSQNQIQISQTSEKVKMKNNSLSELIEANTSMKNLLEQIKIEIQQLIQNIEIEKKQLSDITSQHNSIEASISQLTNDLNCLNNSITQTENQIQESIKNIEAKCQKEKENKEKVSSLKQSITETDQIISELENEIKGIKSNIDEKKNRKIDAHKEVLDYERSMIPIKQNLTETNDKKSKIESLLSISQQEQNKIKNEIELLKKQIQEQQQMKSEAEIKLQAQIMQQARLKGENQASNYRLSEAEKNDFRIQNERKLITDEMTRLKTHEMELKSSYVKTIGESQHSFADDDSIIRQLTTEINELKVKIDFIKNKQSANRMLQKQIKKADENIQSLSSQIKKEAVNVQSKPTIIPNLPNAKPGRRILEL